MMNKPPVRDFWWHRSWLLTATFAIGCGIYSFHGVMFPPGIETVQVTPVEVTTGSAPAFLGPALTELIQDQFLSYSSLTLVEHNADLTVSTRLTSYEALPVAASEQLAYATRLTLQVEVQYIYRQADSTWQRQRTLSAYVDLQGDVLLNDIQPNDPAVQELLEQIANDIFHGAGEEW